MRIGATKMEEPATIQLPEVRAGLAEWDAAAHAPNPAI